MSRYTIRVRQADSLHGTFACDVAHVDGGGDLHVNRLSGGDSLTVARFQHGHWSSYELELSGEAEPDTDVCADMPVKAEVPPVPGCRLHAWDGNTCLPGALLSAGPDGAVVRVDPGWPYGGTQAHSGGYDETRTAVPSWHYPCDGRDRNAEPEPDAPAPISVTFNLSSPVLTERHLRDVQKHLLRTAQMNLS